MVATILALRRRRIRGPGSGGTVLRSWHDGGARSLHVTAGAQRAAGDDPSAIHVVRTWAGSPGGESGAACRAPNLPPHSDDHRGPLSLLLLGGRRRTRRNQIVGEHHLAQNLHHERRTSQRHVRERGDGPVHTITPPFRQHHRMGRFTTVTSLFGLGTRLQALLDLCPQLLGCRRWPWRDNGPPIGHVQAPFTRPAGRSPPDAH